MHRIWLAGAFLLLAACASAPSGFLLPTGTAPPGARLVDMLVMTTRQPSSEPGVLFGGERDKGYSVEEIVVSVPADSNRVVGLVQFPKKQPADHQREYTT